MSPIIYIAKYLLSKRIEESEEVKNVLQNLNQVLSVQFNESIGCGGEAKQSQISLGTKYLLGLWSLCFDYHSPGAEVNVWFFWKDSKFEANNSCHWELSPINQDDECFQVEINTNAISLYNCDIPNAYRYFEEALWFAFLHELGHVKLNHQKVEQIKEEKEADQFAVDIINEEMKNKTYDSRIKKEGVLLSFIYILFHEEVNEWNKDHPSPIQRICDALEQLGCDVGDVLWEIAFRFIKYWRGSKQSHFDETILPQDSTLNYKEKVSYVLKAVSPN